MKYCLPLIIYCLFFSCTQQQEEQLTESATTTIAFGSCGRQNEDLPIFDLVVEYKPDIFVFLGDNIYGDTKDMQVMKDEYAQLGNKPSFQNLKNNVDLIATWDDHDFGWNDAGRHYEFKEESKEIFLDFFGEPTDSERRNRPGIYTSYNKEIDGNVVQIILLDTRTFRDNLKRNTGEFKEDKRYFYGLDYAPYEHADSTLLGKTQWKWLKDELSKPADVRIIGSSTQFGIEFNGYEAWANFPYEQQRLINLIKKTKANGVVFISGDVHYAEISKLEPEGMYPIYDVTSSGLSSTWHFATPNTNRIEGPIMENHFGLLTITWNEEPTIKMEIVDIKNNQRVEHTIPLSDLQL